MSDQGNPSTTVVLAHAAWADGSSWNKVIPPLQHLGLNVVSAQIPLTWSRASGRRGHLGLSIPLTCLG